MTTPRILLALLSLLTLATSAHAECAWALWVNPKFAPTGWRLASSATWYASKVDCENSGTYREAGTPRQPGDVMCLPQGVEPMGSPGGYEYRSWRGGAADTVDPRGPKGK
jgi:hypothetical protein